MSDADILNDFANHFGSDKGTTHAQALNYMPLYAQYFARHGYKRETPLQILEIGTNKGASLRTWAEYFTNAHVYGLDVTRQYELPHLLQHNRIHTALADQGSRDALSSALRDQLFLAPNWCGFDLIIDDGSHEQADQQISLGYLFTNWLKASGLYVVEDLITGENWWNTNQYNEKQIVPTRAVLQIFQQTNRLESPVMLQHELGQIQKDCLYCEYRESDQVIYDRHHPQIAFLGKKDDRSNTLRPPHSS